MDRKKYKSNLIDQADSIMNTQELAKTMAQLEAKSITLALEIDKCKSKKKKAQLEAKLDKIMKIVFTVGSGNYSVLTH